MKKLLEALEAFDQESFQTMLGNYLDLQAQAEMLGLVQVANDIAQGRLASAALRIRMEVTNV